MTYKLAVAAQCAILMHRVPSLQTCSVVLIRRLELLNQSQLLSDYHLLVLVLRLELVVGQLVDVGLLLDELDALLVAIFHLRLQVEIRKLLGVLL